VIETPHDHWQDIYSSKPATKVSWYQPEAGRSLAFIRASAPDRLASIIDVGGGASTLVDGLLDDGYTDITVLDVADAGLALARERLGSRANRVTWAVADVTAWAPLRRWHVWHDRAVFHFQVEQKQQDAYIAAITAATAPGSMIILATFALDGPTRCSGLPVKRYSPTMLADQLGSHYRLTTEVPERHRAPSGAEQSFCWAVFQRL